MTGASRWWSRSERRPPPRRQIFSCLIFIAVALTICVGSLALLAVYRMYDSYDSIGERRAEAQIQVEQQAHAYANALVRNGDPAVSHELLDELAEPHSVRVIEVDRDNRGEVELVIHIWSSAYYQSGAFFGGSSYAYACYEIVLAGLGTDDARYGLATIESCPPR